MEQRMSPVDFESVNNMITSSLEEAELPDSVYEALGSFTVSEQAALTRLETIRSISKLADLPSIILVDVKFDATASARETRFAERRAAAVANTLHELGCPDKARADQPIRIIIGANTGNPQVTKTYFRNMGRGVLETIDFLAMEKIEDIELPDDDQTLVERNLKIIAFNLSATDKELDAEGVPGKTKEKFRAFKKR